MPLISAALGETDARASGCFAVICACAAVGVRRARDRITVVMIRFMMLQCQRVRSGTVHRRLLY
jgi:hypothetical protein